MDNDVRQVNHWVACVPMAGSHGNSAHGGDPDISDAADEESTVTFAAVYLSMRRILVQTVVDGDCAFDVMCLMLGERRHREVRQALRCEL